MPLPTTTKAYYNEHDKFAAAWLRELIRAGLIADGDVDERDIQDVQPKELDGYTQCHFFAGIGVWSYSLRRAGWPDDRPVWTGSCPCQPYSAAGKGKGHADERHLWPYFHYLVEQCKPPVVFGEQVEAAIKHGWLDLVQADLEGSGYAFGTACVPAAGIGAPHIRSRLYFVGERADTLRGRAGYTSRQGMGEEAETNEGVGSLQGERLWAGVEGAFNGRHGDALSRPDTPDARRNDPREHGSGSPLFAARSEQCGDIGQRADTGHGAGAAWSSRSEHQSETSIEQGLAGNGDALGGPDTYGARPLDDQQSKNGRASRAVDERGRLGQCDHSLGTGLEGHRRFEQESVSEGRPGEGRHTSPPSSVREYANRIGATRGFWADCDWWYGRDQKYRPIKPGLQPLAHGAPARVGRLRGYGNAIVAPLAEAFITAYLEVVDERV